MRPIPTLTLALTIALAASQALAADYRAPKNAHGQPDFEGQWSNGYLTELQRGDDFQTLIISEAEALAYDKKHVGKPPPEEKDDKIGAFESEWWERNAGLARIRGQPRTSWIVSPADGQLPFNEQAKARRKVRRDLRRTNFDNPETRSLMERCIDPSNVGPPLMNFGYTDNFQIVQTKDQVAIFSEYDHYIRIVHLGMKHPHTGYRRWTGDSIGHYEGDTLVVETTNFTKAELESDDPRADQTVVERFRRISPTQLYYEFLVTDPTAYEQPWRGEMVLFPLTTPIFEFACHEGNYGMTNILAGAREQEKAAAAAAKAP